MCCPTLAPEATQGVADAHATARAHTHPHNIRARRHLPPARQAPKASLLVAAGPARASPHPSAHPPALPAELLRAAVSSHFPAAFQRYLRWDAVTWGLSAGFQTDSRPERPRPLSPPLRHPLPPPLPPFAYAQGRARRAGRAR